MKNYNNGPRKSGSYACGGKTRKPMMYGGMATPKKKPRKKAQAGGMMSTTQPQQNMQRRNQMQPMGMPMMAEGGSLKMVKNASGDMVPFYAADGKGKMMYGGMAAKKKKNQM